MAPSPTDVVLRGDTRGERSRWSLVGWGGLGGWWSRIWRQLGQMVGGDSGRSTVRSEDVTARSIVSLPPPPPPGASVPQAPSYDVGTAVSTYASFAWVRACVDAITTDLAGLPIVAVRGQGARAEVLDGHPVLDLLAAPTADLTEPVWRRQLVLYLLLAGNSYIAMVGRPRVVSLPILHPEGVRPIRGDLGVVAYEYTPPGGSGRRLEAEDIIHIRLPAWERQTYDILGEGLIRALHRDLDADYRASRLAGTQAQYGRPSAVITPADDIHLTPEARDAIGQAYAQMMAAGRPVMVADRRLSVTFPSTSLRDMEFVGQRRLTRETVLAAFGVPPTRVGLPEANYATAANADRVYWTNLGGLARLIDASLTRILRRVDPSARDVRLRHDLSAVPALQEARTERVARVRAWVDLGASPAAAAAYEGFPDAPVPSGGVGSAEADTGSTAPAESRASTIVSLPWVRGPGGPAVVGLRRAGLPATEEGRAELWRAWIARTWRPSAVRMARASIEALAAQRARLSARLAELPIGRSVGRSAGAGVHAVSRDLLASLLDALFAGELDLVAGDMRDALRDALARAYEAAVGSLDVTGDVDHASSAAQRMAMELATYIEPVSRDAVRRIIEEELARGGSIQDMQARLQLEGAFGRVRALRVARTETTRSAGYATELAYADSLSMHGLAVRKAWLSARDTEVRDPHLMLDGQVRAVGDLFVVGAGEFAGEKAAYPGGFAKAALTVNCRCTLIPVTDEEEVA